MRTKSFFELILVLAGSSQAHANAITFNESPGNYTITGVNWDGSGTAIVGTNNDTGQAFADFNGSMFNLSSAANFLEVNPIGAAGNYILANAFLTNFTQESVIYSNTGSILSTSAAFSFSAVGNGSLFGGVNNINGLAMAGSINGAGAVTGAYNINSQGAEFSGQTSGVSGTITAGSYGLGNSLVAFLAINGVRQTLDVGTNSAALGVDPVTGLAFGYRNGQAVWWDGAGNYHTIQTPGGGGAINGQVTSAFDGMFTVTDSSENLFISNGISTMSFAVYVLGLGVTTSASPSSAWFVGDTNTLTTDLVFAGSIDQASGPHSAFETPLQQTNNTPEPRSAGLLLGGFGLMIVALRRGWLKMA